MNKVEKMSIQGVINKNNDKNRSNDKRDGKSIKTNMENRIKSNK